MLNKVLLLAFTLLSMSCMVFAEVLCVGSDGTQPYTSIQTAINHSTHGDIIQVSPGEYYGHLDTMGKNITIRSLYIYTQDEETIHSTIIHASYPNSCLLIDNYESVIINGFTLVNNMPEVLSYPHVDGWNLKAGGIEVYEDSSVQIINCVVRNCFGQGAGGVYFIGDNFYMSNTRIFECYGVDGPGGIAIGGDGLVSVVFDAVQPNSIYNNTGFNGMDILLADLPQPLNLVLDTFSVILSEPDWFYFMYDTAQDLTISVQHAYFELVNHDLYVSPEGDDNNSGLSAQYPLKTLAKAVKIIAPDSLSAKTIHLAVGEYNMTGSAQFFPLTLKSHTRLIGDDPEHVILNAEDTGRGFLSLFNQRNIKIENITFIPHDILSPNTYPVFIVLCQQMELRNLSWNGSHENYYDDFTRIKIGYSDGVICENITARNATTNDHNNLAVGVEVSSNIFLNNILADHLVGLSDAFHIGLNIYESDATVRNTIISNCYANCSLMFAYHAWVEEDINLNLSNLLYINNFSTSADFGAPISIFSKFHRVKVSNCTFASNNTWGGWVMGLRGLGDIYNCLFYNPTDNNINDLILYNVYGGETFNPSVSYSLLSVPIRATDSTAVTFDNLLIGVEPQFEGYTTPTWDPTQPSSYQLSAASPCVNAGTPNASGLNLPPMDLAGNYRIAGGRIDMGCYEYGSEPYVGITDPELPPPPSEIIVSLYPNPLLSTNRAAGVFIEFSLPEQPIRMPVVEIYNLRGQKVKTIRLSESYGSLLNKAGLSAGTKQKGEFYSTIWNGKDDNSRPLASGVYLVKVIADNRISTAKITIIR